MKSFLSWIVLLGASASGVCFGQLTSVHNGGSLVGPGDLIPAIQDSLRAMGGRMMTPDQAQMTLMGTVTDNSGSRSAEIIIQAPGLFAYREGQARAIIFDGSRFETKSGSPTAADDAIMESLLAHVPDAIYLQMAHGGGFRRIGSHFRLDNSKSTTYTGPYCTVFAFSPKPRPGLARGPAFQQPLFIAIDEHTGLISDVRFAVGSPPSSPKVIQTKFSNWIQQGSQWFPGRIVRLENGTQTLSFQAQQAAVGVALSASAFKP